MGFTAKVRVSNIEKLDNGQQKVSFSANYTDRDGNRVNDDWAQYTPAFNNDIWVVDSVVDANGIKVGDQYTLLYTKDDE